MNFHGFWRLLENLHPETVVGETEFKKNLAKIDGRFQDAATHREIPGLEAYPDGNYTLHARILASGQLGRDWNSADPDDYDVDPKSWKLDLDGVLLHNDGTGETTELPDQIASEIISLKPDAPIRITPEFNMGKVELEVS